jgi:hypothetical protein
MMSHVTLSRILMGVAVALASFVALGTVAGLLAMMSALLGAYTAIRRPLCSIGGASAGGILGFIGIACPVCNKILLLLFGGELLLTYFEPVRVYVAAAGVLIVAAVLLREGVLLRRQLLNAVSGSA